MQTDISKNVTNVVYKLEKTSSEDQDYYDHTAPSAPELTEEELENPVVNWKYNEAEVIAPLPEAKNAVTRDGMGRSDIAASQDPYKEIEKLAKKAAAEVSKRIEE